MEREQGSAGNRGSVRGWSRWPPAQPLRRIVGVTPGLRLMVATGFSICGASAIAALDTVSDADKEEVATAVTLVTLYGSAAIALVPAAPPPEPRPSPSLS